MVLRSRARRGDDDDAVSIGARLRHGKRMCGSGAHQAKKYVTGEQCSSKAEDAEGYACVAKATSLFGQSEQPSDARSEWTAIRGHGERGSDAPFFHEGESASVLGGIAADGERYIVAAVCAFGANAFAEPPDGGVVKEQGFSGDLKKIEESVETADMGEFVSDNCAKLHLGESGESAERKKNHRTEPADDRRRVKVKRFAVADCASDAEPVLHFAAESDEFRVHWLGITTAQTGHQEKSASGAETKEEHAEEPDFDESREQSARKKTRCCGGGYCAAGGEADCLSYRGGNGLRGGGERWLRLMKHEICNSGRGDHRDQRNDSDRVTRRSFRGKRDCRRG